MRNCAPPTALLVLALCPGVRADEPFVDPFTTASPGGGWSLRINPSAPDGEGPAQYTMTHDGVQAWSKELPVTLRTCVVSSAGAVAGYGYDNGYVGWGGQLVVLVLSPDGTVLRQASLTRDGPAFAIDPPPPGEPRGAEVLLDEDGPAPARALIRLNGRSETIRFLPYNLQDGAALPEQVLQPPLGGVAFGRMISCQRIPGAGLTALHWYLYPAHAAFQIIDREGTAIWTRRIDDEYAAMGERWAWWDLLEKGVRQLETSPNTLAITSYGDGHRTSYAVEFREGAWCVDQREAVPAKPGVSASANQPPAPQITGGEFKVSGEVRLGADVAPPLIDDLHGLCFDDRGRLGWVRRGGDAAHASRFILIDREGRPVADHPIPAGGGPGGSGPVAVAWLDGDRWLIARTTYSEDSTSSDALFLDVKTGAATPVKEFKTGSVTRLARTADGGFVVLSTLSGAYTLRDQVARFDKEGRLIDSKTEPGYGQGDLIKDVAVLTDGTLALLVGVGDKGAVRLLPKDGGAPRTLELATVLAGAKEPGMMYIADVRADKDGGLVVYDSAHSNHLLRINKDGVCWQAFHAQGPKGEPFRLYDAFAVDPDGRVWGSDGSRLYRFSDSGRADVALGGPGEGAMAVPVAVTLDRQGRIYALEKGTAAVHIFDPSGAPVSVLRPEPGDTSTQDALAWIRVGPDGTVRFRMTWESSVVVFGPDGTRVGVEKTPEPGLHDDAWRQVPGGGWEENGRELRRLGPDGTPGPTIRHRPDGPWLVHITSASAAPDGSLAVLCDRPTPGSWMMSSGRGYLCSYDAQGKGVGVLRIDSPSLFQRLSYDGSRIFIIDEHGLTAFDPALAAKARRFTLPGEGDVWEIIPRPDGTLAGWKSGSRSLRLLSLPGAEAPGR